MMPYDPFKRMYTPDIASGMELPQWQDIGGEESPMPDMSGAFGKAFDLLRKPRKPSSTPSTTLGHEGMHNLGGGSGSMSL